MFIVDFNPILVRIPEFFGIGPIEIRWYGLFFVLGFLMLYFWVLYLTKKKVLGLERKQVEELLVYMILGIVIGARAFYFIFYNLAALKNPLIFFAVWTGGMSFHGGVVGAMIGAWLFGRRFKIPFWKLLDITSVAAILALMLGRIGNLINNELIGTPFNGPWCFVYPVYDSICRHPYQVYAFLSHLLLFAYLVLIIYLHRDDMKRFFGTKILSINFLLGYGILRIITDIWKVDVMFGPLKMGQWLSVFMIIGALILLKKK